MERNILKTLLFGVAAIALLVIAGSTWNATTAKADGEIMHNPATGVLAAPCAGCHRIHTAPAAALLKTADTVALCKTCHGNGGSGSALNVDAGGSATAALRGGGFVTAFIKTDDEATSAWKAARCWDDVTGAFVAMAVSTTPNCPTGSTKGASSTIPAGSPATGTAMTSNHTLGTDKFAWGNGSAAYGATLSEFACVSCHDPHGGANSGGPTYRILRPEPEAPGLTIAAPAVVTDEKAGVARNYTTADFYNPYTGLTNQDGAANSITATGLDDPVQLPKIYLNAQAGIGAWCSTCHSRYLQPIFPPSGTCADDVTGDPVAPVAGSCPTGSHETSQAANGPAGFDYQHKATDVNYRQGKLSLASYNCNKCHVAHGTNAAMTAGSTAAAVGDPGTDANPSSKLLKMNDRGICRKCHRDK